MRVLAMMCSLLLAEPVLAQSASPTPDELRGALQECVQAKINGGALDKLAKTGVPPAQQGFPNGWEHCKDIEAAWAKMADQWHADHSSHAPSQSKSVSDRLQRK
jgi:hypothetical protein